MNMEQGQRAESFLSVDAVLLTYSPFHEMCRSLSQIHHRKSTIIAGDFPPSMLGYLASLIFVIHCSHTASGE